MFKNVEARFALRAFLTGALGFLVSLKASALGSDLTQAELLNALLDWGIASLTYAGIGYVVPVVEPNIGFKKKEQ